MGSGQEWGEKERKKREEKIDKIADIAVDVFVWEYLRPALRKFASKMVDEL